MTVQSPLTGIAIVYEDDSVIVVDKPAGMLSQPGRTEPDSLVSRVKLARPDATGPMLVHRLDMDTSGLLVLAKNRQSHRNLQQQFEHRRISKRYQAILAAQPVGLGGVVTVPLRLDIDDRPRQIACYEHGKVAMTLWRRHPGDNPRLVSLYPITGRTHQLRVHLAHRLGLGVPIAGDRLYGGAEHTEPGDRLMLHADSLGFDHPVTGVRHTLQCPAPFPKANQPA